MNVNEKAGCAGEGDTEGHNVEQKSGKFHSCQEFPFSGLYPSYLARPLGFNGDRLAV
jgi:hypothetical protein